MFNKKGITAVPPTAEARGFPCGTYHENDKVVNGIMKGICRNDGHCPCHNKYAGTDDDVCPCKAYREEDCCCCALYIKEKTQG